MALNNSFYMAFFKCIYFSLLLKRLLPKLCKDMELLVMWGKMEIFSNKLKEICFLTLNSAYLGEIPCNVSVSPVICLRLGPSETFAVTSLLHYNIGSLQ